MITQQEVTDKFNESKIIAAASSVGFNFTLPSMLSNGCVQGRFVCLCGNTEGYELSAEVVSIFFGDIALALYHFGSFSYSHLVEDGFPSEDAIRLSEAVAVAARGMPLPEKADEIVVIPG